MSDFLAKTYIYLFPSVQDEIIDLLDNLWYNLSMKFGLD
jgi:hypothetical protein